MGRPTDCTQEMIKLLAKCVEMGMTAERACDMNDICVTTYRNWRIWGELGQEPYMTFLTAIKKAYAVRFDRRVRKIEACGDDRISHDDRGNEKIIKGDWQALAWLLERQNRDEFARNITKISFTTPPENLSEIEKLNYMSDELLRKMRAGELSLEAADMASRVIEQSRKTYETVEFSKRIEALEIHNK